MSTPPITRFAPSPTGYLHVGNARMALINWLYARHFGGRFMLRIDDTDAVRSKPAFAQAIKEDLHWMGLDWDETFCQADRAALYEAAVARLKSQGRLYPCYETPEELAFKRKRQLARGAPPKYDRAALALTVQQKADYEAQGRQPHWRFQLEPGEIHWQDLVHGPLRFEAENLSDPVLVKTDGLPVFTLATVVDDMDKNVTHVLRGDDHIANTALQTQIWTALGGRPDQVQYGHLPLLMDKSGAGLSKREGSQSLRDFRQKGIEPMALASMLATMGTSMPIHFEPVMESLIAQFTMGAFSSASPKFDGAELQRLNAEAFQALPLTSINAKLSKAGMGPLTAAQWAMITPNVTTFDDLAHWHRVFDGALPGVAAPADQPKFFSQALALLPQGPLEEASWPQWLQALKAAMGLKGRPLILPLRLALTGLEHGPEMKVLLPGLGRELIEKRLKACGGQEK